MPTPPDSSSTLGLLPLHTPPGMNWDSGTFCPWPQLRQGSDCIIGGSPPSIQHGCLQISEPSTNDGNVQTLHSVTSHHASFSHMVFQANGSEYGVAYKHVGSQLKEKKVRYDSGNLRGFTVFYFFKRLKLIRPEKEDVLLTILYCNGVLFLHYLKWPLGKINATILAIWSQNRCIIQFTV